MVQRRGHSGFMALLAAAALVVACFFMSHGSSGQVTFVPQSSSRRAAMMAPAASVAALLLAPQASLAVTACNPGANNCWSTASKDKTKMSPWKWPAGVDKSAAVAQLKEVLGAYPQEGQNGVDQGGWSYAVDSLAGEGFARLEFKSGIGNFAKFFNGGKPFVDDFEVQVSDDGSVGVRSSSRVGDSDLGVNAKRCNYIAAALRAKGWDAPAIAA